MPIFYYIYKKGWRRECPNPPTTFELRTSSGDNTRTNSDSRTAMRHPLQRTAIRKRPMKLGTTVILMVSAVLFSVLLVVHLIYFSQISNTTRDALADKALAVARTLANSPEIREGLKKKPGKKVILFMRVKQKLGLKHCKC